MNKVKLVAFALALATPTISSYAGGLLTNTNQNITFNRNFARDGAIGIDGVYSNPAGVAFLGKGLHMSFNIQNVVQTRTVLSGLSVENPTALSGMSDEMWQQTPFYQPFKMYGGNENGIKEFKGKATVPILPSFQIAKNYDHWGIQVGFALVGGGGKCTYNSGLGSFERQIAMIPALLYTQGMISQTPSYSVRSYINGQQYVFGVQLGGTYKFNEHLAAYAGFRFNYVYNKYEGNITNITANIGGDNQNLYNYFTDQAETYKQMAFYYNMRATEIQDAATKAQYQAIAQQYGQAATTMSNTREQFADRYLDCTQNGWSICPIIGLDFKYGKWNFGTRLEFTTHFNIENNTKRDDTGLFQDGVNTPGDMPGIWAIGAQYEILPNWRVMGSYHYFFDKDAEMADDKQKALSGNTQEFLAGTEWDITPAITVSCGGQRTKYGLGDGTYLNDMSFVTSSYSFGFGAKIKVMEKVKLNIAYFFTNYEHFKKEYTQGYPVGYGVPPVNLQCSDDFTRTNKVLGVGVDIDL